MNNLFKYLCPVFLFAFLFSINPSSAQKIYFADGYHGGVYGHYPMYVTQLMIDTLNKYPDWKINLEIEPETWDTVKVKEPEAYKAFQQLFADQSVNGSIEYTNPSYAQSYLYNVSGESIIRQFQYGIKKLKDHFPSAVFTTYSSEEPCFTSCLPQVLKAFGFTNAVLKNPNTCWGGYTRAYGGETVNWIGPDGTSMTTVTRYASEILEPHSTWQTTAWNNSRIYIEPALQQGIQQPIGMCLQDAGWRNGRWLKNNRNNSIYTTWRNYFANVAGKKSNDNWRLSQEDIQVSLVWGSQVLQRIAQQVRTSENKIIKAETIASLAKLYTGQTYPSDTIDAAWRTLLLSQHHDCWIVPYNGRHGNTWADKVKGWTEYTNSKSDDIIHQSIQTLTPDNATSNSNIVVYNTSGFERDETVSVTLPTNADTSLFQQIITGSNGTKTGLLKVKVPAMGYKIYNLSQLNNAAKNTAKAQLMIDGKYQLETDKYKLVIDPLKGGAITSLVAKQLNNKEFVDADSKGLNTLRGNFFTEGGLMFSSTNKAEVNVIENGPLRVVVQIKNTIASCTYTQTVQLTQGDDKIDCNLHIDYPEYVRVGEDYKQESGYDAIDLHKAFYNDTSKLIAVFPLALKGQKVYKDAPFDVTESKLSNTFYNRWDSIKNNIVLNWVDVTDNGGKYGFALLTDQTTSYVHGENFPLGLTVQYAGVGLWGRNYKTDSATNMHYAFIPHAGKWNAAALNRQTEVWNNTLTATITGEKDKAEKSLVDVTKTGWQITSLTYDNNDLLIRFYNSEGSDQQQEILFNCKADKVELVDLNNNVQQQLQADLSSNKIKIKLSIPMFGIRTIRLVNAKHL